jgi:hypothetical protein
MNTTKNGKSTDGDVIARALHAGFASENESDRNFEAANAVDGLFALARSVDRLAKAVETGFARLAGAVDDAAEMATGR